MNKGGPEALVRTLRDFKNNDRPMGGVVIIFAGDFRQILPVVPKGTKSNEINARLIISLVLHNIFEINNQYACTPWW